MGVWVAMGESYGAYLDEGLVNLKIKILHFRELTGREPLRGATQVAETRAGSRIPTYTGVQEP